MATGFTGTGVEDCSFEIVPPADAFALLEALPLPAVAEVSALAFGPTAAAEALLALEFASLLLLVITEFEFDALALLDASPAAELLAAPAAEVFGSSVLISTLVVVLEFDEVAELLEPETLPFCELIVAELELESVELPLADTTIVVAARAGAARAKIVITPKIVINELFILLLIIAS